MSSFRKYNSELFVTLACLFFILNGAPSVVKAQEPGITGNIIDAVDRTPLVGVHLVNFKDWRKGTTTDAEGTFTLPADKFKLSDTVVVQYIGYKEMLITVGQLTQTPSISLTANIQNMEQVTIQAERLIAEEFVVKKLSKLDIYTNPSSKADPLLAVNSMPSSTTVDETASVSFRGSSPGETGIFLNHVPTYDAVRFAQLNGIGTFSFFNTEIISSLYVFPGNPPLEYGNTSSGLIALETTNSIVEKSSTSLSLSLANVGFNRQQRISPKQSIMVYANYQPSGPLRALNRASLERIKRFRTLESGIHYINQLTPRLSLKSFHYLLNEAYTFDFRAPTFTGGFRQEKKRTFHVLNMTRNGEKGVFGLNIGLNISQTNLGYSRFLFDIDNTDGYGSLTYGVQKKRSAWKAGIAYDHRRRLFDGLVPEYSYALTTTSPAFSLTTVTHRKILDGFLSYKYTPSRLLAFGYAIRKNVPLLGQDHTLSHQSSISFQATKKHRFTLGRGTFHQLALLPNEGITNIKTRQLSLDHAYVNGKLSATNAVFFKKIEKPELNTTVVGLETYWKYRVANKWIADISYTGLDATNQQGEEKSKALYDLDFFVRGGAQWNSKGWTIGCRYILRQGTWFNPVVGSTYNDYYNVYEPLSSTEQKRKPNYHLIDLNISKMLPLPKDDGLILFASLSNVMNFKNVRERVYNIDYTSYENELFNRRTFYAGLMWVLQ